MSDLHPTVLLAYNETNPELYIYKSELEKSNLNFVPYFEIDSSTPMEEFEIMRRAIESQGYRVIALNINDSFDALMDCLQRDKPDVIFNCIELIYGQPRLELTVAGIYELLQIPFTGAPAMTLANCQNKVLTKRLLHAEGVPTPPYVVFYHRDDDLYGSLPVFPLIVKPLYEDASVGIENDSVVYNIEQLKKRVAYVFNEFKQPALVEQFIRGRELNVAVFGDKEPRVLPVSEIDFSTMPENLEKIVSYQAKWDPMHIAYHKTIPHCPAELTDTQLARVRDIALRAFEVMELRDYARVDMRLTENDEVYVLEVNPNPDLSEGAGFMRSAEALGQSYAQVLASIIELALKRKKPATEME
jgi:D-alanine-D-alanine ligase